MKNCFNLFKFFLLGVVFLSFSACTLENPVEKQANTDEEKIKNYLAQNNLTARAQRLNTGLYKIVEKEGLGDAVSFTNALHVSYTLYLLNGVKIVSDSNYIFQPNIGAFMVGLAHAGVSMKVGEKAQFLVPSSMAFGQNSGELNGVRIESYAVLRMEVEVKASRNEFDQLTYEENQIRNYIDKHKLTAIRHASGLYYAVLKAGVGENLPEITVVKVNYTGKFLDDKVFDSGNNVSFAIGGPQLIKGWNIGIPLMKPREKGVLLLPSSLAYGASGASKIAPFQPLVFEIEVLP